MTPAMTGPAGPVPAPMLNPAVFCLVGPNYDLQGCNLHP